MFEYIGKFRKNNGRGILDSQVFENVYMPL